MAPFHRRHPSRTQACLQIALGSFSEAADRLEAVYLANPDDWQVQTLLFNSLLPETVTRVNAKSACIPDLDGGFGSMKRLLNSVDAW